MLLLSRIFYADNISSDQEKSTTYSLAFLDFGKLLHYACLLFTCSLSHLHPSRHKVRVQLNVYLLFTPNHLLVRHNYFLHNLQLFADFDFSVLQRVKVANTGSLPDSGPAWFRKQNPRRGLSRQPGRGATQNIKILIKHCDKRKLKMCKFMIVQVIFFVANLKFD